MQPQKQEQEQNHSQNIYNGNLEDTTRFLKATIFTVAMTFIMFKLMGYFLPAYPPDDSLLAAPLRHQKIELYADRPTQLQVFDYAEEDGDVVDVNGTQIYLYHKPVILPVQWPDTIKVTGINPGRDGKVITVAIQDESGHQSLHMLEKGESVIVETTRR